MPYVRVADPVLSRWFADPHLDNIACLADGIVDRARQRLSATPSSAAARARGGLRNVRSSPLQFQCRYARSKCPREVSGV
jgi:hypothetical protein